MTAAKSRWELAEQRRLAIVVRNLPVGAALWLATGERGMSSETMFSVLSGIDIRGADKWCPSDPADLRRCLLLLDQVPEWKEEISRMTGVTAGWTALVKRWDELVSTFHQEMGLDWRNPEPGTHAPATYELMNKILGKRHR